MKKVLFLVMAALIFASPAFAHEFILKPTFPEVKPGAQADAQAAIDDEKVIIQIQAAHKFMQSEEMEPLKDVVVNCIQLDFKKEKMKINQDPANNCLVTERKTKNAKSLLFIGHRLPQLWSETTKDVQEGDRASLEAKGFKVLKVGKYEKFAKTLVNANLEDRQNYNKVVNHPLEIVLLTNPAQVKVGEEIECHVLWQGKPLATEVSVGRDGFSQEDEGYVLKTESNAEGVAKFKVDSPGLWFIRVANTEKLNDGSADEWIVRATYVFEIK